MWQPRASDFFCKTSAQQFRFQVLEEVEHGKLLRVHANCVRMRVLGFAQFILISLVGGCRSGGGGA